jgi:hypothetical protein
MEKAANEIDYLLKQIELLERVNQEREAQPVADTVRECLSDIVSHYRALYAGLAFQLNEAVNIDSSDDMAYWKHEMKALERMYAQAESELSAPTPERAQDDESIIETPCHKEVGNHRIPKMKPRKINLDVDDYGPVERAQESAGVRLSKEHRANIEEAIKETEYKYFGMYEFSETQHDAVDLLVSVAQAVLEDDAANKEPQP